MIAAFVISVLLLTLGVIVTTIIAIEGWRLRNYSVSNEEKSKGVEAISRENSHKTVDQYHF